MSRLAKLAGGAAAVAAVFALAACRQGSDSGAHTPATQDSTGGAQITVTIRSEPQSLNWFTHRDASTHLVSLLTQARLVRVNGVTQELEPWLADSWTQSSDGRRYVIQLRTGVTFSDGVPFTSADVVFSFAAAFDPASAIADPLTIGSERVTAEALGPLTVAVVFPEPVGSGLRVLDGLPILPKHKLESTVRDGTFGSAWTASTPPAQIVGLGPFVLSEHVAGERLVFRRNPNYFRKDERGAPLPYLDRVVVQIAPDQNAQLLSLEAGQSDGSSSQIRPEDYAPLKRLADQGRVQLLDLGPGLDAEGLWFNLTPGAFDGDPRRRWIQRDELRQAISLGVNRQLFVDTVFLGAAVPVFGPVSPANRRWVSEAVPHPVHDSGAARTLLAAIGLTDRNGDGLLDDSAGSPARFTLLTQKGQTSLERGAAVIRDELRKIGLTVDVVTLESNALIQKFLSGERYDAVYFQLVATDTDPASNLDFWMSHGASHVWNRAQAVPATEWERQIDGLMRRQASSLDQEERRRLFSDAQRVFAEHLPMVHFAVPKVLVAASTRMIHLTPAVSRPQLLWAADTIAVTP